MFELLLVFFRPYKYEMLVFALLFVIPLVFFTSVKFEKFQSVILCYCIWMMHRWEGFETVSFFYTRMKGSQYSISIHHVDLLIPAVFFACVLNKSLYERLKLPGLGLLIFIIFFMSQFFTGYGAHPDLRIRMTFSIFAHLRMLLFFYFLSELLKIDHLRKSFFNVLIFLIIFVGINCIKLRYLNGVQKPVGGYFTTYNQQGYILSSMTGIFLGFLMNYKNIKYSRTLLYLVVSMSGITAILSQNRGAQMNLFFTSIGVIGLDFILKLNINKVKTLVTLFIFAIAGLVKSYDTLYDRYFGAGKNPGGTMTRKAFYVVGWENIKRHKYTGLGTNLYTARGMESASVRQGILESQMFDRELDRTSPHEKLEKWVGRHIDWLNNPERTQFPVEGVIESYWVLCAVEYGLVAFIPLILLWLYFYYQTVRNAVYFRKRNIYYYALSTGLFGAFTGCIVHNATEWCARQSQAMYFIAAYFALTQLCTFIRKNKTYENEALDFDFFSRSDKKASEHVIIEPT